MMLATVALALAFAAASAVGPLPQMICNETVITRDWGGDLHVNATNSTCYIGDGVTITGSIFMGNGASLQTDGRVDIQGEHGILGINAGFLNMFGNAKVEKIDMYNGTGEAHVTLYGTQVGLGGLKLERSDGDMRLCGASVRDVFEFKECTGSLYVSEDWWAIKGYWGCSRTVFTSDVKVEAITGDVWMKSAKILRGEFGIAKVHGKVSIKDVDFGVAKFELNRGEFQLDDVTGGQTDIKENMNSVKIWNSVFSKITCFDNAPGVDGYGNEFTLPYGQCAASDLMLKE